MFLRRNKKNIMWIPPLICSYESDDIFLGLDISKEIICMKCQIQFYGKNKKKYFKMSFADILPSMLSIELCIMLKQFNITFASPGISVLKVLPLNPTII